MSFWTDLAGTFETLLQIGGFSGVSLKNSSGNLLVRNAADSADADLTAATLKANGPDVILDADGDALTISRNSAQSGALQLIAPPAKSTDGFVLSQKAGTAAGVVELEFVSAANTAALTARDTTSLAFGSSSPVAMFQLPANAVLEKVTVIVDTLFNGTAPTMTVGIAGTTSKYVGATQVNLKATGQYIIHNSLAANGSAEDLIITYSADSSSAGAARVIVDYSVPA